MNKWISRALICLVFMLLGSAPGVAGEIEGSPDPGKMPMGQKLPAEMMPQMMEKLKPGRSGETYAWKTMKMAGPAQRLDLMADLLAGRSGKSPRKMRAMMDRVFFLDRVQELGLESDQVERLKEIRAACRRDNIRKAAEVRIARMDLVDLLEGDWTLAEAEELVRRIQGLQGDMKVRHLTAIKAAQEVLTPEQREKVSAHP